MTIATFFSAALYRIMRPVLLPAVIFSLVSISPLVHAAEIAPFYTFNQSPLAQIYGLPALEKGTVVPSGKLSIAAVADLTSNMAIDVNGGDDIVLDGETYRTSLVIRYGVGNGWEAGIDIPWVTHNGGFMDGFVSGFHNTFNLPQGDRDEVPRDRLLFSYRRDGSERFSVNNNSSGIGDIRLSGAYQLYQDEESPGSALALRGMLKLPTGESSDLHGSGSLDLALWLSGADSYEVGDGEFGFFAGAGGILVGSGDVLPDLQREVVILGTIGIGWTPLEWLALKTQFYAHSPFYKHSSLHQMGVSALQWLIGAKFAFTNSTALDVGVSEDLAIAHASPDVSFHFALSTVF